MPTQSVSTYFSKTIIAVTLASLSLSACTTTKIGKRSTAKAILEQRVTVLTGPDISMDTKSRLVQAGLDEEKCLSDMPACVITLKQADINTDRGLYGAISELFYTSAQQRKHGNNCYMPPDQLATDFAKNYVAPSNTPIDSSQVTCLTAFQDDMLQSVRFAYIYLMYDNLTDKDTAKTTSDTLQYLPKERDTQIQDLYYASIDALGESLYQKKLAENYKINSNTLHIVLNNQPFSSKSASAKLISSYQLDLSKFNTISRRDGLGMNYVALLDDRYTASIRNEILHHTNNNSPTKERIHTLGHLPMTAVLVPKGNTINELLTTNDFTLKVYDPYKYKSVNILNKDYALSANFSAAYGLWLHDNDLGNVSYFNMFASPYQNSQPQLFMLEPYNPNKRVIIMMHGLASSPETWIGLTNDIFNDPVLRDNYQVWQIFYATNLPMLENRHQIYDLIESAFQQVDPSHQDAASQHAVLIGHSMGGVIGRLLVSNDNLTPKLETMLSNYSQRQNALDDYYKVANEENTAVFKERFKLSPLPQVDRAIFISSPFRGTDYADRWFTRTLRRIISLPAGFLQTVYSNLNSLFTEGELANNPLAGLFLENGASQLSNRSFFNKLTANVQIVPNVKVNTLIATDDKDLYEALNQPTPSKNAINADKAGNLHLPPKIATTGENNPTPKLYSFNNLVQAEQTLQSKQELLEQVKDSATSRLSDGIVPYKSAHLDNVESEKLLTGHHNVHTSPQAILELRRILHRQLDLYGSTQPQPIDEQP